MQKNGVLNCQEFAFDRSYQSYKKRAYPLSFASNISNAKKS
jgi:hypothetical protein